MMTLPVPVTTPLRTPPSRPAPGSHDGGFADTLATRLAEHDAPTRTASGEGHDRSRPAPTGERRVDERSPRDVDRRTDRDARVGEGGNGTAKPTVVDDRFDAATAATIDGDGATEAADEAATTEVRDEEPERGGEAGDNSDAASPDAGALPAEVATTVPAELTLTGASTIAGSTGPSTLATDAATSVTTGLDVDAAPARPADHTLSPTDAAGSRVPEAASAPATPPTLPTGAADGAAAVAADASAGALPPTGADETTAPPAAHGAVAIDGDAARPRLPGPAPATAAAALRATDSTPPTALGSGPGDFPTAPARGSDVQPSPTSGPASAPAAASSAAGPPTTPPTASVASPAADATSTTAAALPGPTTTAAAAPANASPTTAALTTASPTTASSPPPETVATAGLPPQAPAPAAMPPAVATTPTPTAASPMPADAAVLAPDTGDSAVATSPSTTQALANPGVVRSELTAPPRLASVIAPEAARLRGTVGHRTLEIRLDPPDLGTVDLEIRSSGSTVTIVARTESAEAMLAVLRQRDVIEASLRQLGMDLSGFDVSAGTPERHQTETHRGRSSAGAGTGTDASEIDSTNPAPVNPEGSVFL